MSDQREAWYVYHRSHGDVIDRGNYDHCAKCDATFWHNCSPTASPVARAERSSEEDLDELTRRVMREINACTPGVRMTEVPTLFAFGPIRQALAEVAGARAETREAPMTPSNLKQRPPSQQEQAVGHYIVQEGYPPSHVMQPDPVQVAPREAPDLTAWQPMETAPRDQTEILVCHDGEYMSVVWWDDTLNGWLVAALGDNSIYGEATHWMPLPDPPLRAVLAARSPVTKE